MGKQIYILTAILLILHFPLFAQYTGDTDRGDAMAEVEKISLEGKTALTHSIPAESGWNLIGLPLAVVDNNY